MEPMLKVEAVSKSYGSLEVLKRVGFEVGDAETFCIIGPNGAGKTTLFKALTGEAMASAGAIRFLGEDVTKMPAHLRVAKGMGRTFQVARVFLNQTALENVVVAVEAQRRTENQSLGAWYGFRPSGSTVADAEELLSDVGLVDTRHIEARLLSHGDKKRLEFALALALRPKILMLDEPTAGMSPTNRSAIVELISRIRSTRQVSIVMTEHDMDVIFGLAHRLMVLNYGEVIATGSVAEVRENPLVREVYLGKQIYAA